MGTGAIMTVTAVLASTSSQYLNVNALLLGCIALGCVVLLAGFGARASLLWAASPLLALYAFHNWDLLAVGCVVAGLRGTGSESAGLGRRVVRPRRGGEAVPSS